MMIFLIRLQTNRVPLNTLWVGERYTFSKLLHFGVHFGVS
jgi:hypothetical protein